MAAAAVRYVTTAEAATVLGISPRTLQRRMAEGDIPWIVDGRRKLVGIPATPAAAPAAGRHEITDLATGTAISMPEHELVAASMAAMRERESMLARVDRAEAAVAATRRLGAIAWGTAIAAIVAAAISVGHALAVRQHRDDLAARVDATELELAEALERAEDARCELEAARVDAATTVLDLMIGMASTETTTPMR